MLGNCTRKIIFDIAVRETLQYTKYTDVYTRFGMKCVVDDMSYVHTHTSTYVHMHVYIYTYIHTYVHTCIDTYKHIHKQIYV